MAHSTPEDSTIYLKPERKIVAAAVAALVVGLTQQFAGIDLFPGAEGAIAVLVGYMIPNA